MKFILFICLIYFLEKLAGMEIVVALVAFWILLFLIHLD